MPSYDDIPSNVRKNNLSQGFFSADTPSWEQHWWEMPYFSHGDARARHSVTVNFESWDDVAEFAQRTGLRLTPKSDTAWFPPRSTNRLPYFYSGPKMRSKYPVCIPSKGRAKIQTTGRTLDELGVKYKFFVEETEYDEYCEQVGPKRVVKLPFHDLGQGSIPARNFIWDWAKEREFARHWVVDDNIMFICRATNNRRLRVRGGGVFNAMEDFVDRYENIDAAGPSYTWMFADDKLNMPPFYTNTRVYSCILLNTNSKLRWRGKYNEDTDLSLRILKSGRCTLLFNVLLIQKPGTAESKSGGVKGGNTDHVYNTSDARKAFAESLQQQHPDVVEVTWKFNRWHHHVDYSSFRKNKLILKPEVVPTKRVNDYGMELTRVESEKSE